MKCIGHRGAKGYEPENTLRSFRRAIELGAHWVEFDVWTVEGESVVIHDRTLERTTNGTGRVDQSSLHYIRSLDAGLGEQVPLLSEVLTCCSGKVGVNVELKGPHSAEIAVAVLKTHIDAGDFDYDSIIVSSFDHRELCTVKKLDPSLKIGALLYGYPYNIMSALSALGCYSVHQAAEYISREFADEVAALGLPLYVYTVNSVTEIQIMRELGVQGVFSDYPDRVFEVAL